MSNPLLYPDSTHAYKMFKATVDVLCQELGTPASVLDVGGNIGLWARAFMARGLVDVECLDTVCVQPHLVIPFDRFFAVDLELGFQMSRTYDWVLCLETAEHVSGGAARNLVKCLCRHADKLVLFSAATPGQGGTGHINEQPFEYWADLFGVEGFKPDISIRSVLPEILDDYYRRNMAVFTKGGV